MSDRAATAASAAQRRPLFWRTVAIVVAVPAHAGVIHLVLFAPKLRDSAVALVVVAIAVQFVAWTAATTALLAWLGSSPWRALGATLAGWAVAGLPALAVGIAVHQAVCSGGGCT